MKGKHRASRQGRVCHEKGFGHRKVATFAPVQHFQPTTPPPASKLSGREFRVVRKVLRYIKQGGTLKANGRVFSVVRANGKRLSVKFATAHRMFADLLVFWNKTLKQFALTVAGTAILECK